MMQLIRNNNTKLAGSVITIGNFDGVHLGHQSLLTHTQKLAKTRHLPSIVVLFEPHPLEFFRKNNAPARLMTLRDKLTALRPFDINYVRVLHFDAELAGLSASDFVTEVLIKQLGMRGLVAGGDFRFGHQRQGNIALLKQMSKTYHFTVHKLSSYLKAHQRISSTRIRQALAKSQFIEAQYLLGRPYRMQGKVIHGQQLGKTLGFPTANLAIKHRPSLSGVFVIRACLDNHCRWIKGVANLGQRPCMGCHLALLLEVHLFDFDQHIYGKRLTVEFLHKLRDEQNFDTLDALKAQMLEDAQCAQVFFSRHPI